jgi:hypothetical protein
MFLKLYVKVKMLVSSLAAGIEALFELLFVGGDSYNKKSECRKPARLPKKYMSEFMFVFNMNSVVMKN